MHRSAASLPRNIIKIVAIRYHILELKCTDAAPDPLAGFEGPILREGGGREGRAREGQKEERGPTSMTKNKLRPRSVFSFLPTL